MGLFRDKHIRDCKHAVMSAVKQKRDDGEMTLGDAMRFRTAFLCCPRQMASYCEDVILPEALADMPAAFRTEEGSVVGEIDWEALADFIERILPVVLEFIKQLLPLFM